MLSEFKERLLGLRSRISYPLAWCRFKRRGRRVWLGRKGIFVRPGEISFGDNVFISDRFHISARDLRFGNDIMIGPNVVIVCDDHLCDEPGASMFSQRQKRSVGPVAIENDVWMGANVTILKGVTVREGSVVGANSLLTKSTPPYTICAGAPCKAIRPRFSVKDLGTHLREVESDYTEESVLEAWREAGL
jgi:acetyltransferase-like isoleucine patch superfamily enzyme